MAESKDANDAGEKEGSSDDTAFISAANALGIKQKNSGSKNIHKREPQGNILFFKCHLF